ncbi:MAG TPA: hypothetical protein VG323_19340 [Thermoanaerobaculia bacterium]|nr:hypothetical protein [Thermoanaerobaculia bacterium]
MNQIRFDAEILRADGAVPRDVVRERAYGGIRVTAEWPAQLDTPEIRVALEVRGDFDRRDAPAYVELFFHDVFLLLNLAAPGSFAGIVSMAGGDYRVRDVTFSARVFAYAPELSQLPIEKVTAWYDGLDLGTQQLATGGAAAALFHLLHLARGEENDEETILRLAGAAEAVVGRRSDLGRLFELREEIARGRMAVIHPMHDDGLDPRVEDVTAEWIDVADNAASVVIRALQQAISA